MHNEDTANKTGNRMVGKTRNSRNIPQHKYAHHNPTWSAQVT